MKKSEPLMYISTNAVTNPSTSPPITAPTKLSKPPMTAAIKPEISKSENSIDSGENEPLPFDVNKRPATAPAAPDKAQPIVRTRSTLTPARRAISGAKADARRASPIFVFWKMSEKAMTNSATEMTIANFIGEKTKV